MKIVVYPQILANRSGASNPYIQDFVNALKGRGIEVMNQPHRNPLFSLFPRKIASDVYIFHWLENVPDYKHGLLQTVVVLWMILRIKLSKKRLVWFLHNKQPHITRHRHQKAWIQKALMRHSDLIVTHASEGLEVIKSQCPQAVGHSIFLHHPTKELRNHPLSPHPQTDILIWGNISPYKGVPEFLRFASAKMPSVHVKVIGKCSSEALYHELQQYAGSHISIENRQLTFDEVGKEIANSRFVLIPYAAESVLSSGVLMDSLSFGAKVIGPHVGSFKDYAQEKRLEVYTFQSFEDIPNIVASAKDQCVNLETYRHFLNQHDWPHFMQDFISSLNKQSD